MSELNSNTPPFPVNRLIVDTLLFALLNVPLPIFNSALSVVPQFISIPVISIELSVIPPLPDITTSEHPLPSLLFRMMLKLDRVSDPLVSVNTLLLDEKEVGMERVTAPTLSEGLTSTVYALKDISDASLECVPFSNLRDSKVDPIV